jgi:uncharacterized protein YceH (UPF0502 family)
MPRKAEVDEDKQKELEHRVSENEKRILKLQRRLDVAEIKLGISGVEHGD